MTLQNILLTALDQRYDKYLVARKRCRAEFSEETVHDLRIAARRLLAFDELLRIINPHPRLKKLRRALKDQLDSLNDLRDTQVMLAEISERLASLPEFAPLQKFLQKRENRLLKAAESEISAFKTGDITRRIVKIRADLAESAQGNACTANLLAAGDEAYITVSQRKGRIDPAQPASIHRVRVAFKKFRYMLEILQPILPGLPAAQFKAMHAYQAKMGEIQDAEVLLRTLADFAAKHKTYDPQPVRRFYEQRHAESINAYLAVMHEFDTFWRATPEKPFSWEQIREPVLDAPRPRRRTR
jgi:CHAD domain-containing protein